MSPSSPREPARYEAAGIRGQKEALSSVLRHLGPTLSFAHDGDVLTGFGHYAAVIRVRDDLALAICTDGVGSKTVVAAALDRYDTIGFDCMAMNVNDLICVGARPLALVDYLGVNTLDERRIDQLLEGLSRAAKEAGVAVPGGEVAQLPEVIGSAGGGRGEERAFDLVGTCLGMLHPRDLLTGDEVAVGDILVGLPSSGLHSNGFTLARRVLREAGHRLEDEIAELGCTLGEELLRPTEIYVRPILGLWNEGVRPKALAHITGDGLLNLCRVNERVGYVLDDLFEPQPIFGLIAAAGDVDAAEMHRVFNMGTGFVVVVAAGDVDNCSESLGAHGIEGRAIGRVTDEAGTVRLSGSGLVGDLERGFGPA